MRKISLGGISVALLIGLFYTFVFCMIGDADNGVLPTAGTVPVGEDSIVFENEEPDYEELSEPFTEASVQTTISDGQLWLNVEPGKWMASGVPVKGEYEEETVTAHTEEVPETSVTTSKPVTTTVPVTTTTAKITTTKPVTTTAKVTATVPVTTTPKITTTTPIVTTTPVVTTTKMTTTTPIKTTAVPVITTTVSATTTVVTTTPKPETTTAKAPAIPNEKLSYVQNGTKYNGNAYELICQMVNAEMGSSFHEEALKAQAVAAYSYMKYSNDRGIAPSVALKGNVPKKVSDAVAEVFGQTVCYNGKVAQTVYSASSGGYSASAKDVWGSYVPYLVSVEGKYDSSDRYYGVTKTFTKAEVKSMIESTTGISLSDNPENWITLLPAEQGGVADGGYVGKLLIDGKSAYNNGGKNVQITGRVLRENIFGYRLRSSKFTVAYADGVFTFTTYGYGHGVGMSQLGANAYATQGGYDYRQILEHYYTGITIQ